MTEVTRPTVDVCPDCTSPGRVVTAVTVRTLGDHPKRVLVTRQCVSETCLLKYPVFKSEAELTSEERAAWRQP